MVLTFIRASRVFFVLLLIAFGMSCVLGHATPSHANRNPADSKKNLRLKIELFERFVKFRRSYEYMDLNITFRRSLKGVKAGYQEGQIIMGAKVPVSELSLWSDNMDPVASPDLSFLQKIRRSRLKYSNISRWYQSNTVIVGVDYKNSVIVYYDMAYRITPRGY